MKASQTFRCLGRVATSFWHDTSGIILPYVTVLLVVIVGMALLALDGGRAYSLQTQLQNIADAAALAGAAELNRAPGARQRATNAINNLVSNRLAGMDVTNVSLSTPVYYETLPQANTYFSSGTVSPDDGHARFVAVTLTHTMNTIFPVSFLSSGAANSYTAGGQAVAGSDVVACQYTPMFICNPYETNSMTYDQATAALQSAGTGTMVALQGAGNAQYSPGNFGWIQPASGSVSGTCGTGQVEAQAAALSRPPACFRNTAINTKPGNMTVATDGLNTRFDLYRGAFSQCNTDANYPPAPNVRKGMIPGNGNNGACNPNYPNPQSPYPPTADGNQAMGFPLDNNMLTNGSPNNNNGNGQWTCGDITASVTGVITSGNGNNATVTLTVGSTTGIFNGIRITDQTVSSRIPADTFVRSVPSSTTVTIPGQGVSVQSGDSIKLNGYWSTEHPPGTSGANNAPSGCTAAATISRASVYQYEIDNNYLNDASYNNGQPGGEVGAPRCSTAAAVADRRFLNVAVLNCLNLANENYSLQGSASNLPVAAFAKFFLTLPVKNASGAVYAEYQGIVTPGSGGGDFYSQVQLYR